MLLRRSSSMSVCVAVALAAACSPARDDGPSGEAGAAVPSVDHLAGEPVWSESAAMTYLSEDGSLGFSARLCRYPEHQTSWAWITVHEGDRTWSYVDNHLPSGRTRHELEAEKVVYELPTDQPVLELVRQGAPGELVVGRLTASVRAHEASSAPEGAGDVPLRIEAEIRPTHPVQRAAPGRCEVFGEIVAMLWIEDRVLRVEGSGKWHEQHQERPRWISPFSYLAASGDGASLLAVTSPARSYGFFEEGGRAPSVEAFSIEDPAARRHFEISLDDGRRLAGVAHRIRQWSVPIYDDRRPGSHVRVEMDGRELVGGLNDYQPTWED